MHEDSNVGSDIHNTHGAMAHHHAYTGVTLYHHTQLHYVTSHSYQVRKRLVRRHCKSYNVWCFYKGKHEVLCGEMMGCEYTCTAALW